MLKRLAVITLALLLVSPVWAVGVDAPLDDPALEARARALHKQLRCLVCQNQSIEDSNAELAQDLRLLVRERITAGDSDQDVIRYIVDRYGDWVLLKPPLNAGTLLLWFGPPILLAVVAVFVVLRLRRRRATAQNTAQNTALSAEEEARVAKILQETTEP